MAAGVPHLRGLQQHHEKEQGALRHDRSGGAETQKAEEEKLKAVYLQNRSVSAYNHTFIWVFVVHHHTFIRFPGPLEYALSFVSIYDNFIYFKTFTACFSNRHSNNLAIMISKLLE